jgi:tetratricopeptide (TPR) repeat protein
MGWAAPLAALACLVFSGAADSTPAVDGRVRAGDAALEAWDVPTAARIAEAARADDPESPAVAGLLGRVRLHQARYAEAAALLAEAGPGFDHGLGEVAKASAELLGNHRVAESEHFVFRYPAGKDEILVPYALDALEKSRERIGAIVGLKPEGAKVVVDVVDDAHSLSRISTLPIEAVKTTGTVAICKFDRLMITSPKALLRGYEWQDTLAHEYLHLLISRKSRNRTPIWLHEGMAKYLETAWRGPPGQALELPVQAMLRDATRENKLITFEEMHPSIALLPTARDAALAFAEVFAAIEFLHGKDQRAVSRILDLLADGADDQEAVAQVFGAPFAKFEAGWRQHLKHRPYPTETGYFAEQKPTFKEDVDPAAGGKDDPAHWRDVTERGLFAEIADPEARRAAHLGELLRERGKAAAAAAKFGQAVGRAGNRYPIVSNKYALTLLELGEFGRAVAVLEGSLRLYPNDPLTRLNLARATMSAGDPAAAEEHLLAAIGVDPFDPEIHARLLEVARAKGDEALAERASRALALLGGGRE